MSRGRGASEGMPGEGGVRRERNPMNFATESTIVEPVALQRVEMSFLGPKSTKYEMIRRGRASVTPDAEVG